MGELIADLFITLDGYAYGEGAPAYFGYPGPELERWVDEHLAMPQVLLMGRVTYEALLAITQNHPVEGPDRMSELPKVVFSRMLQEPLAWDNSRVAKADLFEEVRRLKAESEAPLRTIGSLSVVKGLLEARMVDRLRLTVFPLILGSTGRESVFAGLSDIHLELIGTEVLDARLVTLEYRPATARQTD